jgi:hypothetical protein
VIIQPSDAAVNPPPTHSRASTTTRAEGKRPEPLRDSGGGSPEAGARKRESRKRESRKRESRKRESRKL